MTAARVREVTEAAFTWVSAERHRFVLGDGTLDDPQVVNTTWKPLGELAQVCSTTLARTAPTDPLHALATDLLEYAWKQTGQGDLLVRQQRREPFATYPLEVYAAFASAGLRHDGFAALAAQVAGTRGRRLVEQWPVRRLGVLLAERHCGRRPDGEVAEVLRRTWLGGLPEPWTFERLSGYTLTHVVYHLTDWGRGGPGLPPDLAGYLELWLPAWLDTCLDAGMWDLSCELLAVAASLPSTSGPAGQEDAWTALAAARHPTGAVPEEAGGAAAPDDVPDFLGHYHSTLMAAFAGVLALGRLDGDTTRVPQGRQGAPA
ncbi:hypothetical protein AB0E88_32780 [Streptomyces sp. NPDC028635]|uniref:DUF6895 family protein n=1 Tax=Streptomyces sp. NPDC028635 TaxID=3154800 RepID=UPI0033F0E33F